MLDGIARHHHVIAFDNRGVGASGSRVPADLTQMGVDAIAFIRALGRDTVDLFGFSLGGAVARHRAARTLARATNGARRYRAAWG